MDLLAEQSGLAHSFRILAVFDKHFQRLWRAKDVKVIIQRNSVNLASPPQIQNKKNNKDNDKDKDNDQDKENEKEEIKTDTSYLSGPASLWVLWNDADIAEYMNRQVPRSFFEYTVEISPPTEAYIKSFLYHKIPDFSRFSPKMVNRKASEMRSLINDIDDDFSINHSRNYSEEDNIGLRLAPMYKYSARFDGLTVDAENSYSITISTELDGKTITQVCHPSDRPAGPKKEDCTSPKQPKDGKDSKPSKKK